MRTEPKRTITIEIEFTDLGMLRLKDGEWTLHLTADTADLCGGFKAWLLASDTEREAMESVWWAQGMTEKALGKPVNLVWPKSLAYAAA